MTADNIADLPNVGNPPPMDIETEHAVLGAILRDDGAMGQLAGVLKPVHFYDPMHARMFEILGGMAARGEAISVFTVNAAMKHDPGLAEVGGMEFLRVMAFAAPALPNFRALASIIVDHAARREIIASCNKAAEQASGQFEDVSVHVLLETMEQRLVRLKTDLHSHAFLPFVVASEFEGQNVPAREDLVEGLIPRRNVTMLGGDGGTGKSQLALQLAVCLQTEANWCGRVVMEQGPVVFLTAEDEEKELHIRLAAILAEQGATFGQMKDLHLLSMVGRDALLGELTAAQTITPTTLFHKLEAYVRRIKPRLVVLDTLSDLFGGDEVKRLQARQFIGMLRGLCLRHDTTILLLAHPSLDGIRSGSGTSGSTGWNNSVRSRLYFNRIKTAGDVEDDPDARELVSKKANYGPTGLKIRLRWQRGVFVTEAAATGISAIAVNAKAERVFLEMLATYTAEGRRVGTTTGHGFAPTMFAADKRSEGVTKTALTNAMNRLFQVGKIRLEETGPASKRVKGLVLI